MVVGVPWKCNPEADEAEEVMPSDVPPAPIPTPTIPRMPPTTAVIESVTRRLYVRTKELDPYESGIGFTLGCLGC